MAKHIGSGQGARDKGEEPERSEIKRKDQRRDSLPLQQVDDRNQQNNSPDQRADDEHYGTVEFFLRMPEARNIEVHLDASIENNAALPVFQRNAAPCPSILQRRNCQRDDGKFLCKAARCQRRPSGSERLREISKRET
ncbi:hypothetical protein [Bosea caraganae]|uniref:hypothetical protein n=1 Tax=Bosea caraganae TaxID=2763117 RepID=UPI001AEC9632|nr:hypothetical protein [Bosea caraganae]